MSSRSKRQKATTKTQTPKLKTKTKTKTKIKNKAKKSNYLSSNTQIKERKQRKIVQRRLRVIIPALTNALPCYLFSDFEYSAKLFWIESVECDAQATQTVSNTDEGTCSQIPVIVTATLLNENGSEINELVHFEPNPVVFHGIPEPRMQTGTAANRNRNKNKRVNSSYSGRTTKGLITQSITLRSIDEGNTRRAESDDFKTSLFRFSIRN